MISDNRDKFQEYYRHYRSPYTIFGECRANDTKSLIALEIRKNATLGCELFTVIAGVSYCITSELSRGCLQKLLLEIPQDISITLDHWVILETNEKKYQLLVSEEIFTETKNSEKDFLKSKRDIFIILQCKLYDTKFCTGIYEFDDIDTALDELKSKLHEKNLGVIQACSFCRFMDNYANSAICLRDIQPTEFATVQNMLKRRERLYAYYDKIAWDIELLHYCSGFTDREEQ